MRSRLAVQPTSACLSACRPRASEGPDPTPAATLTHNGDSNFSVWAWGTTRDLLVNEIGAYDGTVLVESGLFIWDVSADGDWTVTC